MILGVVQRSEIRATVSGFRFPDFLKNRHKVQGKNQGTVYGLRVPGSASGAGMALGGSFG